ncbi:hypothetical protein D3C81_2195050 [compost metagenome]
MTFIAVPWSPVIHIRAIAGNVTSRSGTCAMPRISAAMKKMPTAGIPASAIITPTSSDWIRATPITP